MKITVVGAGYVGFANGLMLSQGHEVTFLEVNAEKIEKINKGYSLFKDFEIYSWLDKKRHGQKELNYKATSDAKSAYKDADYIIIAVPTNYDADKNYFDTHIIEDTIKEALRFNTQAPFVIKSTIPIGYCDFLKVLFPEIDLFFSPEFLREGRALTDCLEASRVVVGMDKGDEEKCKEIIELLNPNTYLPEEERDLIFKFPVSYKEAESIKLFANTYLAMRVAFFNELDTFAYENGLNPDAIIKGICTDSRIGQKYNNPSFGYGGYCLPKDTKQLLANYDRFKVPQKLIEAIVESNDVRKDYIAKKILEEYSKCGEQGFIYIYGLKMKAASDNMRCNSTDDIIPKLVDAGVDVVVYEPLLEHGSTYLGARVDNENNEKNLDEASLIVSNRPYGEIQHKHQEKLFTRDLYMLS